MDLTGAPSNLLADWVRTLLVSHSELDDIVPLLQLTDAQRATQFQTYLNNRISNNNTQLAGLAASTQATTTSLNADTAACQSALSSVTLG